MLRDASWILFDVETAGRSDAAQYLGEVEADKRMTDPVKIAADLEKKKAAQLEKLSLDWNTCRIVALGYLTDTMHEPCIILCRTEEEERLALQTFWALLRAGGIYSARPTLIGYNVLNFDLKVLIQRSRYLRVDVPHVSLRPFDNRDVEDLFRILTFDDAKGATVVMERTLDNFCKQFGIDIPDPVSGEDVPRLIAGGQWEVVGEHCRCDLLKELALARAVGIVLPALTEVA